MATIGLVGLLADTIKPDRSTRYLLIQGSLGSGRMAVAAAVHVQKGGQSLIVTSGMQAAERAFSDLQSLLPPDDVVLYPGRELLPNEEGLENVDLLAQRMEALCAACTKPTCAIVAPFSALVQRLMPPAVFKRYSAVLRAGERLEITSLAALLVAMGYERVDMVEGKKQFSVRGGIIDIFTLVHDNPFRIELFDDEIDSIREFDVTSQRSRAKTDVVQISPVREFIFEESQVAPAVQVIGDAAKGALQKLERLGFTDAGRELTVRISHHLEQLATHRYFDGVDQYLPFIYEPASLVDYLNGPTVIVDEPDRSLEQLSGYAKEMHEMLFGLAERGKVLPDEAQIFSDADRVLADVTRASFLCVLPGLVIPSEFGVPHQKIDLSMRTPSHFHGKVDMLIEDFKSNKRRRGKSVAFVSSAEKARRLVEVMRENDVEAVFARDIPEMLQPGCAVITVGQLESGFQAIEANLTVYSDLEIYGQPKRKRHLKSAEEGVRISSFTELRPGDYVVHINHGIGRYVGLETLVVSGAQKDYLNIKYAGEDRLYVPTDQTDLLQRYIGAESEEPKLNKLGGTEWAKVKNRVKESVREMARGLLELYAKRETVKGHTFSVDTVWQKEFETAFPYDETPDQERVIDEIKHDMELAKPMDRLLCGDVGYGKTEVAMRAAFKAVMDNKQVAVLVPTTILSQQHYNTFVERFKGFPVNITVMSRFQTPKHHQESLKKVERGDVDIVIGTHRLLQKDVVFKDLGLLIVDEEQRFGVGHKEKIKELKKNVDVLTLTATPIPRTLHMSMVGVRDVSLIETPPENRFPVRTFVAEYDEQVLRDAIRRELDRDGQVYFVYNRVQTMDRMVQSIRELVPEAEVAVAHGQMDEHRLERVMVDFYEKRYDILVCTTIIETGMDISNVNTIFIYDADHFGLAQLYQLRGRVGRTNRVAYAYLFFRREKSLTEVAEKRLSAIKEFTDFGSGFKIAMRDLEIRGAGNLLGPEQHGQIASVGFELYCRLLEQAVHELKGEVEEQVAETSIDLGIDAYIPPEYIDDERQKISIYKKIASIETVEDTTDLIDELVDRYGEPPASVTNLMAIARIKHMASKILVNSIMVEGDMVVIRFMPGVVIPGSTIEDISRRGKGRVTFQLGKSSQCRLKVPSPKNRITMLEKLVAALGLSSVSEERLQGDGG